MQAAVETVNQWLVNMSRDWETPVTLDEEGACAISAANGFTLELYVVSAMERCFMNLHLMDMPIENREGFYEQVLAMNMHQQETHGATLAVDPKNKSVLLCYSQMVASLTAEDFQNLLQNLLSTAETLVSQLKTFQREQPQAFTEPHTRSATAPRPDHPTPAQPAPFSQFMQLV
ncbi:CesT family type III secretion system chaperone [Acanthopleuribacter pedis]|uniref:CesT family type III secretion system chaperone n=1 Tax=Acanthopleuribacter pedis TaxID=442870 RepID=A0A8J7QG89_9BACT|nr:CesT family type III secretion system chaperone [Acanthopleuribacter pedis]MBO1319490.1 CesT family type III secretion system chaperone [Acanthopleuribacter pedis]